MKVKIAIVDSRIDAAAERRLTLHGFRVLSLPPFSRLSEAVASHPDMLIQRIGNEYISYADYCEEASYVFSDLSLLSVGTGARFCFTADEVALMRACGTLWGCDACQFCCPHNRKAEIDPLPEFAEDRVTHLPRSLRTASAAEWDAFLEGRAFAWRGREVLQRNLELVCFTKSTENAILMDASEIN